MSTPLVYVGGSARSGSTLLESLLARIPGFCSVGELVFIWERGLKRNDRCGCGARFHDCAFWAQVGEVGFGGWSGSMSTRPPGCAPPWIATVISTASRGCAARASSRLR